jgi:hypothetical protein
MKKTTRKALRLETHVIRELAPARGKAVAGGTIATLTCPPHSNGYWGCPTYGCPPASDSCPGGGGSGGSPIGGRNLQ